MFSVLFDRLLQMSNWNPDTDYYEDDLQGNQNGDRATFGGRSNRGFFLTITNTKNVSLSLVFSLFITPLDYRNGGEG